MLPPSSTTLTVSTIAPTEMSPNTRENVLDGLDVPIESGIASPIVNSIGPHKSQFFNAWLRRAV